jgi:EAL and modified HD-GYP domain-containing signal transduction protein
MLNKLVAGLWGSRHAPDDDEVATLAEPEAAAVSVASPVAQAHSVMRREAMLGRDQKVAAYTFMLRRTAADRRDASLPEVARLYDANLLDNLHRLDIDRLAGQRLAFVPLATASLDLPQVHDWPTGGTVWWLSIDFETPPDAAVGVRMAEHKARGAQFALPAAAAALPGWQALLPLADYVVVDVGGEDMAAITAQMTLVSKFAAGKRFVAHNVQTLETFHACHKLQFALFVGPFVTRREMLDSPPMGPSRAKVLDLMNRVRTGAELTELGERFRHDPTLSMRLLRYVNSPGIGLMNKVGGIEQALMVLGQDKLYRWLTLILFTGGQNQDCDQALMENALVRARLAESLASKALFARARDEVFITGLFSLLDVVLRTPMEQVLKQIPLPAEISEALINRRGPYAPYLALAIACEQDDQAGLEALASEIGSDLADINVAHVESLLWAQQLADL